MPDVGVKERRGEQLPDLVVAKVSSTDAAKCVLINSGWSFARFWNTNMATFRAMKRIADRGHAAEPGGASCFATIVFAVIDAHFGLLPARQMELHTRLMLSETVSRARILCSSSDAESNLSTARAERCLVALERIE